MSQQVQLTKTFEVKNSSVDKTAHIYIFNQELTLPDLDLLKEHNLLFLNTIDGKYIYIQQPFISSELTVKYGESPEYFALLKAEIDKIFEQRNNKHYLSTRITASLLENDGKIVGFSAQDINAHIFEVDQESKKRFSPFSFTSADFTLIKQDLESRKRDCCIREACKHVPLSNSNAVKQMSFYSVCPGCDFGNHSEAQALEKIITSGKQDELAESTLYLYGHWWCCEPCSQKLLVAGVSTIIISKEWARNYLKINELI